VVSEREKDVSGKVRKEECKGRGRTEKGSKGLNQENLGTEFHRRKEGMTGSSPRGRKKVRTMKEMGRTQQRKPRSESNIESKRGEGRKQ